MRIATECPKCLAELQIPEERAGKMVKCLECGGHVRVPGGEQDAPEETPRTRRGRDEEPEDRSRGRSPFPRNTPPRDDEDRPRRRKAKSRKISGGGALWITLAIVLLVVISAGTIVLMKGSKRDAENNAAGTAGPNPNGDGGLRVSPSGIRRPALPAGWVDFHHPNSLYWVYVPKKPDPVHSLVVDGGDFEHIPTHDGFVSSDPTDVRVTSCHMHVETLTPVVSQEYKTGKRRVQNTFLGQALTTTRVTWGGEAATEMEVGESDPIKPRYYLRWVILGDKLYQFTITRVDNTTPSDADRKAFFDSVVFGKKS